MAQFESGFGSDEFDSLSWKNEKECSSEENAAVNESFNLVLASKQQNHYMRNSGRNDQTTITETSEAFLSIIEDNL